MIETNVYERLRHRISAGMINPETLTLDIPKEEARELVQSFYNDANSGYIDYKINVAAQKVREISPEAEKQTLQGLRVLRSALKNEDEYIGLVENLEETVFGVPLRVV